MTVTRSWALRAVQALVAAWPTLPPDSHSAARRLHRELVALEAQQAGSAEAVGLVLQSLVGSEEGAGPVLAGVRRSWAWRGRDAQQPPPGPWLYFLALGGRGAGKSQTVTEFALAMGGVAGAALPNLPFMPGSIGVILSPTNNLARKVTVEGPSGLLRTAEGYGAAARWKPTALEVDLGNGTTVHVMSAENPDRLRGIQSHWTVVDELGAFTDFDAWNQVRLLTRLPIPGDRNRIIASTTPRPVDPIIELDRRAREGDPAVALSRMTTYENAANLGEAILTELRATYEGTTLGAQELEGVLLDPESQGALLQPQHFHWVEWDEVPPLGRVTVSVDPTIGGGQAHHDECGVAVVGRSGSDGYVLADLSLHATTEGWCRVVVDAAVKYDADEIVYEGNAGGDLIPAMLARIAMDTGETLPRVRAERSRASKVDRARPVALAYEQGRIFHVGELAALEHEWVTWIPGARGSAGRSPNRIDAVAQGFMALGLARMPGRPARVHRVGAPVGPPPAVPPVVPRRRSAAIVIPGR